MSVETMLQIMLGKKDLTDLVVKMQGFLLEAFETYKASPGLNDTSHPHVTPKAVPGARIALETLVFYSLFLPVGNPDDDAGTLGSYRITERGREVANHLARYGQLQKQQKLRFGKERKGA